MMPADARIGSRNTIPVPFLRKWIAARRAQHLASFDGWKEPHGYLIPTEPDRETRERIMASLSAAADELEVMDDYICDVARIDEKDR